MEFTLLYYYNFDSELWHFCCEWTPNFFIFGCEKFTALFIGIFSHVLLIYILDIY